MPLTDIGDSQAVLSSIMASSTDGIIGQKLDGTVTLWSAGAEQMYGWTATEMRGQSIRRVIPEDLGQELDFVLARVTEGERVKELLTRRVRKDGSVIDVSLTLSPLRDESGRVVGASSIERDVTRRRRIEAMIDGQRRMLETLTRTGRLSDGLRDLLDSLGELTTDRVLPAVQIIDEDRRLLRLGASRLPAQLIEALRPGIPIAPRGHPAGEAAFKRQAVSTPDFQTAQGFEEICQAALESGFRSCCALPILSPDGTVLGTLDLYRREPGDPPASDLEIAAALAQTAALAIDRFETVRDLRLGREVLLALNEINSLITADLEVDRIIRRATEEGTRLVDAQMGAFFYSELDAEGLGYRLHSLSGEKADRFVDINMPRNTPLFSQTLTVGAVQRLADVTEDPRFGKNEPYGGFPKGHPAVRSFMSAPVTGRSGEIIGMLLFGHEESGRFSRWHEDILRGLASQTALALDNARLFRQANERADALAHADQRKNEFLAMVGHELRGPLGAISTSLAVIDEIPVPDGDTRDAISILQRQTDHMKRLVDDLLDLSRITRGKILLKKEVVDARYAVRQAVETALVTADMRQQAIQLSIPDDPVWIEADAVRLEQVFGNLLNNAIKFSPPKTSVFVDLVRADDEARIMIRDEGVGIEPDKLRGIFEMFVQAKSPGHAAAGGLGLGLTLVRELARLHGGSVTARSEGRGKGSEFEVRLPAAEAPPDADTRGAGEQERPRYLPVLRILLAEDNPDAARAMVLLLRRWGHKVAHVAHGFSVLDKAMSMRPDVAVLDIGLPGMDGWELAQRLRDTPGLERVRLAALTGLGQRIDEHRSRQAGFERHFVKPVDPSNLRAWFDEVAASIAE